MARLSQGLTLRTGLGKSYNFNISENYKEVFNVRQEVDNSDSFIKLVGSSTSISAQNLQNVRAMVIKNHGKVGAEIQLKVTEYKDNSNVDDSNAIDISGDGVDTTRYISFLLAAGEYIFLPHNRWVAYENNASAANAKPTTSGAYLTLDTNEYVDSTADNDAATEDAMTDDTSATRVYLEPYTSAVNCTANLFHVGDLIRLDNEIMEVTAIGSKADLANNYIDVIRGTHGSTIAVHADDVAVRLPFFNAYGDFDDSTLCQTDSLGRFKVMNFFGFGRVADSTSDGIVPGSISGKFYLPGYQAFGMKGITPNTNSGLSVSTAYFFTIAVDGGSTIEITFTTDGSNVTFGGSTGVIRKIQDALDVQFYTAGNLFEKRVLVGIVDGDLRFTSGQYLSTSAVALTAGTSGASAANEFFDAATGRIPASPAGAVASKLPVDTIVNSDGITVPNLGIFFYDDGYGNIKGAAEGRINYSTGAINFTGLPNAEFTITANYDSAHGGGANTTSDSENVITTVSARSCNSKLNTPIEIVAFN